MTSTAPMRMEYDPFSPVFQADPFPVYRWMRDEAPVFYSEKWDWGRCPASTTSRAAALDPATFLSFEGIDIDDTAKDLSRRASCPTSTTRATTRSAGSCSRRCCRGRSRSWRTTSGAVVAGCRRLADRASVDIAQELSWPHAQRGVLRPARAAHHGLRPAPAWSAGRTSSRTASPTTPAHARRQGGAPPACSTTSSTCSRSGAATRVRTWSRTSSHGRRSTAVPFAAEHIDDGVRDRRA